MNIFQSYFDQVKSHLDYGNYTQLTKRIIDLTLDTKQIDCYKSTLELLDWLDTNPSPEAQKERFSQLLDNLYTVLSTIQISNLDQQYLVSVNGLTKKYQSSTFTLGSISFQIQEGQIVGLVGENGNGKTTLLRSLCGELHLTSGTIKYHFSYADAYDLRTRLIYIPQRTPSWQGSLLSNLQFTAASYGIKGDENVLLVELIVARMGLRKYRSYSWANLSSGYKMRFELARALLRQPKLLLIDEPLANLDVLAQQTVLEDFVDIVRSPFRPMGIVLSSQQLYEVEKTSDYVIFLKNGTPYNLPGVTHSEEVSSKRFIVEFDSVMDQQQLRQIFQSLAFEDIALSGGTYIARFSEQTSMPDFLRLILEKEIPITYLRDISDSTRRFFLS